MATSFKEKAGFGTFVGLVLMRISLCLLYGRYSLQYRSTGIALLSWSYS